MKYKWRLAENVPYSFTRLLTHSLTYWQEVNIVPTCSELQMAKTNWNATRSLLTATTPNTHVRPRIGRITTTLRINDLTDNQRRFENGIQPTVARYRRKVLCESMALAVWRWSPRPASSRHKAMLKDYGHGINASHCVPVYHPQSVLVSNYTVWWSRQMFANGP